MRSLVALFGCLVLVAIVPSLDAGATAPQSDPDLQLLKPGVTYAGNFPYADRHAACLVLEYREGTSAFTACLLGNFPENPWFAG